MHTFILENVSKTFEQKENTLTVLKNLSVTFNQGTSYAIKGISGSGKSTLLHILSGFEKPTQGRVLFDGTDIHAFSPHEHEQFLHSSLGILFQTPHLIQELTVIENIMLKGLAHGCSHREAHEKARTLLDDVQLSHKAQEKPAVLSGGEQQRVALARALMNDPQFLLADEPTAHLDIYARDTILTLLIQYKKTKNMGIILSSHDPYVTHLMDHQYILEKGVLSVYEEPLNHQKCC